MTEILGSVNEIRLVWRSKPELRSKIVRIMLKQYGHPGVRALAQVLNVSYSRLYEVGGLEGRINKLNSQRRQRRKRQAKKLENYSIAVTYEQPVSTGGGKRGKCGGLQDIGRRAIMCSVNGQ